MDDSAAGEVEKSRPVGGGGEKAAAPHPMRDRGIDEEQPQRREPDEGGETHAIGKTRV
jgi:hypothetical protein